MPLKSRGDQLSVSEQKVRNEAKAAGVDLSRLPRHVAIIMDGNGRWAQERAMPRLLGHRQGYLNLRTIVRGSADLGIEILTLYVFSAENWRRPEDEVGGLMKLIEQATVNELRELHQNGVRFRVSGEWENLPTSLQAALQQGIETTQGNDRLVLNLALNYGGRAELVRAIRSLARDVRARTLEPDEIDEAMVSQHLYTADLPDPDLLIRTAGEMRVSNFLLWQIAYAELFVTETLWPDFTMNTLFEAVASYQKRVRKYGGVA